MKRKYYAYFGMMSPVIFWVTYIFLSVKRAEYSFLTKAVSELGSLDAPHPWIWNVFGYILPGILIAIYTYGLVTHLGENTVPKIPLVTWMLSGGMMTLSGIFPGDFEERTSFTMVMHSIGSIGSYLFFLIAAFSFAFYTKYNKDWKTLRVPLLLLVWSTLLVGNWPIFFPEFPAVGQRIVFLFYFAWIFITSMRMYKLQKESAQ